MKKKFGFSSLLAMIMTLVLVVGLAGCSSNSSNDDADSSSNEESDFTPVTISTKFGDVTIEQKPERVVALGWGDAETALALGVEPIGASDWLAFGGDGVGPWLDGAYTNSPTILGTMELDYEQIAALEPDLILDVRASGEQERYDRLSEIATTVGIPEGSDNWLTSFEDQVRMISKALGQEEEGEQLLASVDTAFADAKSQFPQFADKSIVVGAYSSEGYGAYITGDARVDFVTKLGFTNKKEIEDLATDSFYVKVSDEQLELLDADLTVMLPIWVDSKEITDNPLYQKIPSVEAGRSLIIEGDYANAFSAGTVPALLWAIEELPAMLNTALEGGQ